MRPIVRLLKDPRLVFESFSNPIGVSSIRQIFLIVPPYSGSTAMAALLLKSARTWRAGPDAEGQWVPAIRAEMRRDPWNPAVDFDWPRIHQTWMRAKPRAKSILVEKSPPNLLRVRSIMETFPDSLFVVSNRNPYAWLSSVMYREHRGEVEAAERRRELIMNLITAWIFMSHHQVANVELVKHRGVITTYESFCAAPQIFLQNLSGYCGDLQIDPKSSLRVKDYPEQGVVNMNAGQIARLTAEEIALVSQRLAGERAVLKFFGYDLIG